MIMNNIVHNETHKTHPLSYTFVNKNVLDTRQIILFKYFFDEHNIM